jgi:uncharacterized protein YkwD
MIIVRARASDSLCVGGHRTRISILALAIALGVLSVFAAGAGAASKPVRTLAAADQLEVQVLAELNKIRRQHGLTPLRLSRPLSTAADAHSRAMGTFGFFDHDSRDGSEFWERVQRFYGPNGYRSWSVGENLLWSSGALSAAAALKLWMGSPGHRRNILTARWREIGLSALKVSSAPGVYGGRDVVIITSDFGVRS